MTETYKCPICGTERELKPKPDDATRLVAECDCRGSIVGIVDMPAEPIKPARKPRDNEGEK